MVTVLAFLKLLREIELKLTAGDDVATAGRHAIRCSNSVGQVEDISSTAAQLNEDTSIKCCTNRYFCRSNPARPFIQTGVFNF